MPIHHAIKPASVYLLFCLVLQVAEATEVTTPYRFEAMVPPTQLWDFNEPRAIAVAPDGSIWLADHSPNRIQHARPDGSIIAQFSLNNIPNYDAHFIRNMHLADDGSLWIVGYTIIWHISSTGTLIKVFKLGESANIAIAKDGSVWLTHDDGNDLQHFTAEGELITRVSNGCLGDFADSVTLADGSYWSVYSTSMPQQRQLVHYDAPSLYVYWYVLTSVPINITGTWPKLSLANDGSIWITNAERNDLQHFTAQGERIQQDNPPCIDFFGNITRAPDGSLWVVFNKQQIQHYTAEGQLIATLPITFNGKGTEDAPVTISVAGDGSLWVVDTLDRDHWRLQHLDSTGRVSAQVTTRKVGGDYSVAAATDGSVWLTSGHSLQHINADGSPLAYFGAGWGTGQFQRTDAIALGPDDSVWVYDDRAGGTQLEHFDASGNVIAATSNDARAFASFYAALASKGSQFSAYDFPNPNARVTFNTLSPAVQAMLTKVPEGSAGWNNVTSINVATDGSLWVVTKNVANLDIVGAVADPSNDYFWHLTPAGDVIAKIKGSGGIAPLADGSVWIANAELNRIQHFAADGRLLTQFGSLGIGRGQFNQPKDIAVATDGSVWVADMGNQRIQKFSPKTLANYPAEYDDKNGLLYLDDVAVAGTHYQATLQLQHGKYRLLTQLPALAAFSPAASFNATTNLLSIPLARAFGQDYQAQFQYLGDSLFQLQSAKTK